MAGETFSILEDRDIHWWLVESSGTQGWAPVNYLEVIQDKVPVPPPIPSSLKAKSTSTASVVGPQPISKIQDESSHSPSSLARSQTFSPRISSSSTVSKQPPSSRSSIVPEETSLSPRLTRESEKLVSTLQETEVPKPESQPIIPSKPAALKTSTIKAKPLIMHRTPPLQNAGLVATPLVLMHQSTLNREEQKEKATPPPEET
jgi:hypothetical protein